jgi:RNA polymerase sigma factor (sigma-70 family)
VGDPPGDYRVARIGEDAEAFESFYREHVDAVLRYATRRTDDPHEAADLVADVFLAAIHSAAGYREELGSPLAWLYGIARNVAAAERRRAAQALAAESRIAGRRLLDQDDIARLEERIDAERAGRILLGYIAELSESQRAVLELVAIDGLTVAEAATALGISTVTARVRLHRARRALHALHGLPSTPPPDPDLDPTRSFSSLMEAR